MEDADGNLYETVLIGDQCWMAKNLNVGVYVASVDTGVSHSDVSDNSIIEKYCYDNTESNCDTYGGLYDWNEMMEYETGEGAQGICPTGWHIPTDREWHVLEDYLKDEGESCDSERFEVFDCDTAGIKLKSGGISGFDALLAGYRYNQGSLGQLNSLAYFWSSSESDINPWARRLDIDIDGVMRRTYQRPSGLSVRCLKD